MNSFEQELKETERRAQEALSKLKASSNRPPAPPWTRQRDDRVVSYSYQNVSQKDDIDLQLERVNSDLEKVLKEMEGQETKSTPTVTRSVSSAPTSKSPHVRASSSSGTKLTSSGNVVTQTKVNWVPPSDTTTPTVTKPTHTRAISSSGRSQTTTAPTASTSSESNPTPTTPTTTTTKTNLSSTVTTRVSNQPAVESSQREFIEDLQLRILMLQTELRNSENRYKQAEERARAAESKVQELEIKVATAATPPSPGTSQRILTDRKSVV